MFELGVEFPVARIRRVRSVALGGGSAQVILTGVLAIGISRLLGLPLVQQVFFGAIVSLSSTVVILKLLLDRGEMDTPHGEISVGIALVQDLSLVAMMGLLPAWGAAGRPPPPPGGSAAGLPPPPFPPPPPPPPPLPPPPPRLRSRELFLLAVV